MAIENDLYKVFLRMKVGGIQREHYRILSKDLGRSSHMPNVNTPRSHRRTPGNNRVEAIAMSAIDGLMRGIEVIDMGAPLSVLVDV
ncbi:unnamed protein product, partial [Dovyalis caffra]